MSNNWRRWYWLCECGNAGDAAAAKWVEVGPRLMMLCPRCNRKVDIPTQTLGQGKYQERDDFAMIPKRSRFTALGEKI